MFQHLEVPHHGRAKPPLRCAAKDAAVFFFVSHSDLMVPKVSPGAQGLPREKDPARQPITVTTAWGTTGGC